MHFAICLVIYTKENGLSNITLYLAQQSILKTCRSVQAATALRFAGKLRVREQGRDYYGPSDGVHLLVYIFNSNCLFPGVTINPRYPLPVNGLTGLNLAVLSPVIAIL
jgi:hypothetical protein